jgi:hypothetical protein
MSPNVTPNVIHEAQPQQELELLGDIGDMNDMKNTPDSKREVIEDADDF